MMLTNSTEHVNFYLEQAARLMSASYLRREGGSRMPYMSLEYDDETDELLDELKQFFGVKTKSAVIRRSLALARVATRKANKKEKTVALGDPQHKEDTETFSLTG
jgi:hypothetical protein